MPCCAFSIYCPLMGVFILLGPQNRCSCLPMGGVHLWEVLDTEFSRNGWDLRLVSTYGRCPLVGVRLYSVSGDWLLKIKDLTNKYAHCIVLTKYNRKGHWLRYAASSVPVSSANSYQNTKNELLCHSHVLASNLLQRKFIVIWTYFGWERDE